MSVLANFDAADFMALPPAEIDWMQLDRFDPRGKRIALHLDAGAGMPVESETRRFIERAAHVFAQAGSTIVEIPPFFSQTALDDLDLFWRVRGWVDYLAMAPERRELLLPFIREWVHGGKDVSGEVLMRCVNRKLEVRKVTQQATEPFDLVLSPVSPVPTFPVDWPMPSNDVRTAMAHIAFTVPYNMSEQPAISINAGFTEAGKAVGLQIAGRRFADLDVLRAATWFESHRPSDAIPDWTTPSVGT
jgi:aspartyl-tRNA(Asn)/glutamyl-tRNA(Gln) amidotransferase subunit A